jgi:hypothetical protein
VEGLGNLLRGACLHDGFKAAVFMKTRVIGCWKNRLDSDLRLWEHLALEINHSWRVWDGYRILRQEHSIAACHKKIVGSTSQLEY